MILLENIIDGTQNGTPDSYFGCKVIKNRFWNRENEQSLRVRRIRSKHHLRVVDMVLESSNIILLTSDTHRTTIWLLVNTLSTDDTHVMPVNYVIFSIYYTVEFFGMSSYDLYFFRIEKCGLWAFKCLVRRISTSLG